MNIMTLTANYILPTSKDVPGSGEYFDEVISPSVDMMGFCPSVMI